KLVIAANYSDVEDFSEDVAAVTQAKKRGYIDKTGNVVIPIQFDRAGAFSEGFAYVKLGNRYGYIDKSGQIALETSSDQSCSSFKGGLAVATKSAKKPQEVAWGYIDKSGKYIWGPINQLPPFRR